MLQKGRHQRLEMFLRDLLAGQQDVLRRLALHPRGQGIASIPVRPGHRTRRLGGGRATFRELVQRRERVKIRADEGDARAAGVGTNDTSLEQKNPFAAGRRDDAANFHEIAGEQIERSGSLRLAGYLAGQ